MNNIINNTLITILYASLKHATVTWPSQQTCAHNLRII